MKTNNEFINFLKRGLKRCWLPLNLLRSILQAITSQPCGTLSLSSQRSYAFFGTSCACVGQLLVKTLLLHQGLTELPFQVSGQLQFSGETSDLNNIIERVWLLITMEDQVKITAAMADTNTEVKALQQQLPALQL